MTWGPRSKQEGACSPLLTQQENEKMEELLGRRCSSMATAVVQLFMALPHNPSMWSLQHTGVVSFVKDIPKRSYFIRVFDLKAGCQFWEQELYTEFVYNSSLPYFHTFTTDDCEVGLNFASAQEAEVFQRVVEEKIDQRNNRHEKTQQPLPAIDRGPLPLPNTKGFPTMATVEIPNPDIQASRYRSMPTPVTSFTASKKGKEKKGKEKKGKKKLSKADIGVPTDFTVVHHVGPKNPDLVKLLTCARIGNADEETSQLIDIMQGSESMETPTPIQSSSGHAPPPPPLQSFTGRPPPPPPPPLPPLQSFTGRPPPPPPPPPLQSFTGCPPPPLQSFTGCPPPPPLQSFTGRPPPPPPPPPPQSFTGPPTPPPNGRSRWDDVADVSSLLSQIRLGKKLKNVTENPETSPPAKLNDVAQVLMAQMEKRKRAIHPPDEDEDAEVCSSGEWGD